VRRWRRRSSVVIAGAGIVAFGVLAFLTYGNTTHTGSTAAQVRSWVRGTGLGQSIGTLVADTSRVRLAVAQHKGASVLHTDCGVLVTDAEQANGELPTPDSQLTNLLSSGYTFAYEAGNDCYSSGDTNAGLLERADRERIKAEAKLDQAVQLVDQLTHGTLSTTTTTEPDDGGLFG